MIYSSKIVKTEQSLTATAKTMAMGKILPAATSFRFRLQRNGLTQQKILRRRRLREWRALNHRGRREIKSKRIFHRLMSSMEWRRFTYRRIFLMTLICFGRVMLWATSSETRLMWDLFTPL